MSYREALDKVAIKLGYKDFIAINSDIALGPRFYSEAAELYARAKHDEACEAMENSASISYGGCNYEGEQEAYISFSKPQFKP